jgi:hypothetical protein
MDTIFKYLNIKTANEVLKTVAVLVTAMATSLAAYYSYQSVQESRVEAAYAREYAFSSEKRFMIGRLKAAAISLKQAENAYDRYRHSCCSYLSLGKKEDPELTLRYGQNILNAANNFLTILVEAGAYNVVEANYHIKEINIWISVLPHAPNEKPVAYRSRIDELIDHLDGEYKNLTNVLSSPPKIAD